MTGIIIYDAVMCAMTFLLGAIIGSFLNVVIYRTPAHMSIVNGPSHCFTCGERIKPYDLVPIFSWIFLGGKCRSCKARISFRYTFVEALTGFMYLLAYVRFSLTLPMLTSIILFSLLIVLSFIDIDHMEIPYWCTISIAAIGIATFFTEPNMPWWEHFAGAAVIAVPFAVFALFGGMGGGDVQLMAAAGFVLGWKIVPSAVIGVIIGAVYGIFFKTANAKRDKEKAAAIEEKFREWLPGKMNENSSDTIVGEYEDGKVKISWDIFEEKAWLSTEKDEELENALTALLKDIPEKNECIFRITADNGEIRKVRFQQRMAFGPALSIGIAIGILFGETINKWYLGML